MRDSESCHVAVFGDTAKLLSVRRRVDVGSPIQKSPHVELEFPNARVSRRSQTVPYKAGRRRSFASVRPANRQHGEVSATSPRPLSLSTDSSLASRRSGYLFHGEENSGHHIEIELNISVVVVSALRSVDTDQ